MASVSSGRKRRATCLRRRLTGAFAGFVGLWPATFPAHFTPAVEVGWRFAVAHWGQGYAPEGAAAALDYGFDVAGLDDVVSMTTVGNTKSRRVMEKLGMHRDPADRFIIATSLQHQATMITADENVLAWPSELLRQDARL